MAATKAERDAEPAPAVAVAAQRFALLSGGEMLTGTGQRHSLPPVAASALASAVTSFFATQPDGPSLLVGALPYERAQPCHLFQPEGVVRGPWPVPPAAPLVAARGQLRAEPSAQLYRATVERALAAIAAERGAEHGLRKLVLARTLLLRTDAPIDVGALLRRLAADQTVTAFAMPLPARPGAARRALVGATPELLVGKAGDRVTSRPLAGSARRLADPAEDQAAAAALLRSAKDRREHAAVVEAVLDELAPFCRELGAPQGTVLASTATMWHLGTRIEGRLKDAATPSVALAAALHPTPAVCGVPRERAARAIAELEPQARDFYAGAVGWCDGRGDGRWHVAIRCAEIAGNEARLYAGAGIVEGSDPVGETEETAAKFAALLGALGIDERGLAVPESAA
ncbi:MAG TPA: isochorismate synthase [Xanthobacteraceae bacterium]|nr:isochorismate synthase [Xanthobacteraceae bacterium]